MTFCDIKIAINALDLCININRIIIRICILLYWPLMIVYIYISKVKNIKIPLTNLLLIRKFYMIQLNRICQPSKKNNWKLGFLWHKLKRKGLFIYLINRLYKRFNKLDSHNVYYILLYIFYNRCHVSTKVAWSRPVLP